MPPSSSPILLILCQSIPSLSCLLPFALPIFSSFPPLLFPRRLYFWSEHFIQSLSTQSSRAGPDTGKQRADGVRHSRNRCRWSPLLLYITHTVTKEALGSGWLRSFGRRAQSLLLWLIWKWQTPLRCCKVAHKTMP